MWIFRKIRSFSALPFSQKLLLTEVLLRFAIVEVALRFLPFKVVLKWLAAKGIQAKVDNPLDAAEAELKRVRVAIRMLGHYLPFIKCYNKALTARLILRRKGYESTLFIGFKKDDKGLKGHAWLKANDLFITGGYNHAEYQVTATF
ncbi:MAG: lasso peptide biosynthesis B2 protein [Flammeovirgaceae bacterium]